MNDGADDIYSLLNYSTIVPSTLDSSSLADSSWQVAPDAKVDAPLAVLDDGRFVIQNNGQYFLLSVSLNNTTTQDLIAPDIVDSSTSLTAEPLFIKNEVVSSEIIRADEVPEKETDLPEVQYIEGAEEKFLFLCAQCSDVFGSVEQCRDHMIKDHNMILSDETPEVVADSEEALLPLQPIDTNSNNDKNPTSIETVANEENENDQENTNNCNTENKLGASVECEKEPICNKTQKNEKIVKLNSRRKKNQSLESDPDYDLRPFKCKHISCVHRFRSTEALQLHAACHQAPNRREYACSQCSEKYDDWRSCAMHLWNGHSIDVDLYTCSICGQHKAPSRMILETHMRIHRDVKEFGCPECGKAFKQKAQLRNHRVTHIKKKEYILPDAVTPRWYMEKKCDICFKTYADSKCLKKHIQAVHSKLKPYVCNVCGHSSARKAMLQAHLRQHTGEKPYACNTCHFKTGDHNSLRRHMMRHSGVRPYKCPHCSYASIQSTSFKNHLQIRHPGKEGVFHCTHCSFRTVSHNSYLQHLSDHKHNLISNEQNDVEVFPENVAAAQLIYQCLGGYQGDGARFQADVTASSTSGDGTKQTITIEIPTGASSSSSSEVLTTDDEDTTHCFLPSDDVNDAGGITIPADAPDADAPHSHITLVDFT